MVGRGQGPHLPEVRISGDLSLAHLCLLAGKVLPPSYQGFRIYATRQQKGSASEKCISIF